MKTYTLPRTIIELLKSGTSEGVPLIQNIKDELAFKVENNIYQASNWIVNSVYTHIWNPEEIKILKSHIAERQPYSPQKFWHQKQD